MNNNALAGFVSRNHGGRALFLTVPVAVGAIFHAATYALWGQPLLGMFVGCLAAVAAMALAAWTWLDEPAAVALEKRYEHGMLTACVISLPLALLSPILMAGMIAAGMASFGASLGIVRIAAYVDAPEAPPEVERLAKLAWLCQVTALAACLSSSTPLGAALAVLLSLTAAVAASFLKKEESLTVIC
ncbi:MAG TPA: hypothetical protein VL500_06695 [Candidatus Eisenbacteria bacterium]|jgi:hypothetical protein|nr:hypothetical protein [Candidatus Eisenbacteria bacterium]